MLSQCIELGESDGSFSKLVFRLCCCIDESRSDGLSERQILAQTPFQLTACMFSLMYVHCFYICGDLLALCRCMFLDKKGIVCHSDWVDCYVYEQDARLYQPS